MRNTADVETPLLGEGQQEIPANDLPLEHDEEGDAWGPTTQDHNVRLNHATATLAVTMLGAGIMALPRAFAILGIIPGLLLNSLVYCLSLFSLGALVTCSNLTGKWTYAELAFSQFGSKGSSMLRWSIVLNNGGAMTVYLIIIGDVLCGVAPDYSGLITNLFGVHDPTVFWVSRPFVMAVACVACLGPMVSLRSLHLLGPLSNLAVAVAGAFVTSVLTLTGIAAFTGKIGDFHWWPSLDIVGHSPAKIAINLLATLPVVLMSFVCHYNVLPVARNLERFTDRRINMVIRRSLTICSILFTSVAAAGYALFGSATKENVLLNLSPEAISEVIPLQAATVLCFGIRLGYCLCLMTTFTMLNWSLRETLSDLWLGVHIPPRPQFLTISYVTLLVVYVVSVVFPSVWTAMTLTGATAAVFVAYILPGALILKVQNDGWWNRVMGSICVGLGCTISVIGVLNTFVLS